MRARHDESATGQPRARPIGGQVRGIRSTGQFTATIRFAQGWQGRRRARALPCGHSDARQASRRLFRGLHRRGVAGAAVGASARVVSHCFISARSGAVSSVSSTVILLLSVAAAVAIVGASASRPERLLVGLSAVTVTAAITASRTCVVKVGCDAVLKPAVLDQTQTAAS